MNGLTTCNIVFLCWQPTCFTRPQHYPIGVALRMRQGTNSPEPQESGSKIGVDVNMTSVNALIAALAVLTMMYTGNVAKMELMTFTDSKIETLNTKIETLNTNVDSLGGELSKFRMQSKKGLLEVKREIRKLKMDVVDLEYLR